VVSIFFLPKLKNIIIYKGAFRIWETSDKKLSRGAIGMIFGIFFKK